MQVETFVSKKKPYVDIRKLVGVK